MYDKDIQFTHITKNIHIKDINISTDIDKLHHELYAIYKFKSPTPHTITINNKQELITTENFNFCTLQNDTCISDSLRQNILFEKFLMALLSKIINPHKNMLDVGANIGVWSIVFSTFMKGNIYAFEPQEEIFNCLINNIKINQCKNVIPYNLALSNTNSTYLMNASYDNPNNFGAFKICSDGKLLINAVIGDELNLLNIGFIKIDVEGHELKALMGLSKIIQTNKPIILIEIHISQEDCNNTFNYIIDLGYKYVLKITHCDYLFLYDTPINL